MLFDLPPGQLEYMRRQEAIASWVKLAKVLGKSDGYDQQKLRWMQEFIANTSPEHRCPCKRGVTVTRSDQHFPGCEKIAECEEQERESELLRLEFERLICEQEQVRQRLQQRAHDIKTSWSADATSLLSTDFLAAIKKDCENELARRRLNPFA